MTPDQLEPGSFASYPKEAKQVVTGKLPLLRKLPTSYVALLLREAIAYDWKFPAERVEIDQQLTFLKRLDAEELKQCMSGFARLRLSSELEQLDWVNAPGLFSEHLSAYLWATGQIDAFRTAATEFVNKVHASFPAEKPVAPRLSIAVIGQGVNGNDYPLFRKLRPNGTYFEQVKADNGCQTLLDYVCARAAAYPGPYLHWYVDGGQELGYRSENLTCVSYHRIERIRSALLKHIKTSMESGVGPEALRTSLAQMRPEQLGLNAEGPEGLVNRFQMSVLTEGSGTQIYSTTFVQWSARELLRRAQPLTLLTRYAPRQQERSMEEMLENAKPRAFDVRGSLIDADMGAYYTWINQERLPDAGASAFLVWFENHNEALAIGAKMARGRVSGHPIELAELLHDLA
ncbi:MAG: hypothetical protein WB676_10950 [Bryobacteraceae bacterium]